jgi:serine/threonine protein kinase
MGVVYMARDLDLERQVAVKTLPHMSTAYAMRLRREARAMASVLHPNLALIFGAETWNGTPMLIFEYLSGGTLSERIARNPLCPRDAIEIGIVMAEVLERIHTAGVLHCDIKPSNIGYTAEGIPKLLDFGLARILYDSHKQGAMGEDHIVPLLVDEQTPSSGQVGCVPQSTRQVVGTPLYMSPEAVQGQPPDESFDLWSTNIVIYESIAGRNPVRENTLRESMERILRAKIPDLREASPDCPMELAEFMKIALAKNKAHRPSSAKELKDLLWSVKASC